MKNKKVEKLITDTIIYSLSEKSLSVINNSHYYSISRAYYSSFSKYIKKFSDRQLLLITKNFNHRKHPISGNSYCYSAIEEIIISNFMKKELRSPSNQNYYSYSIEEYSYVKPDKSVDEIVKSLSVKQRTALTKSFFGVAASTYLQRKEANISFFKKVICSGEEILFYKMFRGNYKLGEWGSTRHLVVKDKKVQKAIYERLLTTKCNPIKTLCVELLFTPEYIIDVYNKVKITDHSKRKLQSNMSYWIENNIQSITDDKFPIEYFAYSGKQFGRWHWSNISVYNSNRIVDNCMKLSKKKRLSALVRMADILVNKDYDSPVKRYVRTAFSTLMITLNKKDLLIFMGHIKGEDHYSYFPVSELKEHLFSELM
jgi:hypothetical protein